MDVPIGTRLVLVLAVVLAGALAGCPSDGSDGGSDGGSDYDRMDPCPQGTAAPGLAEPSSQSAHAPHGCTARTG